MKTTKKKFETISLDEMIDKHIGKIEKTKKTRMILNAI